MSAREIPPNPPRWQPNSDPGSIFVPGLDTDAPVLDQIEQIEQLITIKLQNVDETFSKIHHVVSNKILPAVKRYAVGTEPVREAAKFWTSFYEQAAQIRIPTYDDFSSINDQQSHSATEPPGTMVQSSAKKTRADPAESTVASEGTSFLPGQQAFSSTPAPSNRQQDQTTVSAHKTHQQSWSASIDSSLACLDKELRSLGRSNQHESSSVQSTGDQSSYISIPSDHSILHKDKQPETRYRQALHSSSVVSSTGHSSIPYVSPLKFRKLKTPVPKKMNPYLPPNTEPANWSGIVDLSQVTPRKTTQVPSSSRPTSFRPLIPMAPQDDTGDDSFDGLPAGMSPPILMSPARPPRSSAELILGKTPTREAAVRITKDLITDVQRKGRPMHLHRNAQYSGGLESSMSTLPTPPSFSQYRYDGQYETDASGSLVMDSSLERMMERVGLGGPRTTLDAGEDPGLNMVTALVPQAQDIATPVHQDFEVYDDSFSDDSLDVVNNTAHPSAAFLMASQRPGPNDSFDSNDSDVDDAVEEEGLEPVHPFAGGPIGNDDDGFDDSFDDPAFGNGGSQETETLFGVPANRMHLERRPEDQNLFLLGQRRQQDTIDGSNGMGHVLESPTPVALYDQSSLH